MSSALIGTDRKLALFFASSMSTSNPASSDVVSVTQLTDAIKLNLSSRFSSVSVSGELSGVTRAQSGHVYLTLKDKSAALSGIIWRSNAEKLKFDLSTGLEVICHGHIDVYPARGTYQLIIRKIQPQGVGELELAFRQLHQKLNTEGLFDPSIKKPLPRYPKHVAVVTSPTGAAVRDFLQVLTRRWPNIRVTIVPAKVQGADAAKEIASAIDLCDRFADRPDVVVVTRGGGSLEDLWSFNEEVVCRAVHSCSIPVISGVGHEIDVTLCDLVADVRALTPSEAAERIVPEQAELIAGLTNVQRSIGRHLLNRFYSASRQLDSLQSRPVIARPLDRLLRASMDVDTLESDLNRCGKQIVADANQQLGRIAAKLESINPLSVLARGYSVTIDEKQQTLTDCQQVQPGDKLTTRLATGSVVSRVESSHPGS